MAITVIGPQINPDAAVQPLAAPVVEAKKAWGDDWEYRPELELVRATAAASGQELGSCELRRRYGKVKEVFGAAVATQKSWDLLDWWVRVRFPFEQGLTTVWMGRITAEDREVHGSVPDDEDYPRSGVQRWIAHEPLALLRKIQVADSYWLVAGAKKKIGWVPSMNERGGRTIVGNRSATEDPDGEEDRASYLFGGEETWSRYQFVRYLLEQFVDETADDGGGPSWWLGAGSDLLGKFVDVVPLTGAQTVAQLLRRLIAPEVGLDYRIVPFDLAEGEPSGFEIQVYALTAEEWSFGGVTLPRNTDTVRIKTSSRTERMRVRIARSSGQRYSRIRVVGGRIVVCCSLGVVEGSLVPKWSDALETAYKDGTGDDADDAAAQDAARADERFRPVYQMFGAPTAWDHKPGGAVPVIDESGAVVEGSAADYQNQVRRTLSWLPLREGVDYRTDPATDNNPSGHQSDLSRTLAWVFDPVASRYVRADELGMDVFAAAADWGVLLSARPNHRLALGHWSGARDTEHEPELAYNNVIATIAFESDQRLVLEVTLPEKYGGATPAGGVRTIQVPGAELWYLAPYTVVGVDVDGNLVDSTPAGSAATGRVLRNDAGAMAPIMAGALARYYVERARAEIGAAGLLPWSELIGQILTVVDEAGELQFIYAPITSVEWELGEKPSTTIRTGYA